jgi:hypothetical protein
MSDSIPSQFVSPSPRSELNGKHGLTLREITSSLGNDYTESLKLVPFLKKNGFIAKTVNGEHFLTLRKAIEFMELGKNLRENYGEVLEKALPDTTIIVRK